MVKKRPKGVAAAVADIKVRHIGNCLKADPAYGEGVAKVLGIPMSEAPKDGQPKHLGNTNSG